MRHPTNFLLCVYYEIGDISVLSRFSVRRKLIRPWHNIFHIVRYASSFVASKLYAKWFVILTFMTSHVCSYLLKQILYENEKELVFMFQLITLYNESNVQNASFN